MAPGFIAIGSGPAGLSAAETFRSKHPHIPVRILSTDPALPYAKPPLSKAYLCGREAKLDLHSHGALRSELTVPFILVDITNEPD